MGKSNKKATVEVAAAAASAFNAKAGKKGKRDAEEELEKAVSAKKQKKEEVVVKQKKDDKKSIKASQELPSKKKPETDRSEDLSSSESEEETDSLQFKVPAKQENKPAKASTKKSGSSSGEDSSSDDEPARKAVISEKKVKPAVLKRTSAVSLTKKGKPAVTSSDSSDSKSDEDDVLAKVSLPIKRKSDAENKAIQQKSQSKAESSDESSDESDDEPEQKKLKPSVSAIASSAGKANLKGMKKQSSSDDEEEESDDSSKESSDGEPSKVQQDKPAKASKESSSSDEDSSEESDDEPLMKTHKKDNDVKMKDATSANAIAKPTDIKTEKNAISGSKTLFVGNLSFDAGENDVAEFFKASGEVVEVRLAMHDEGHPKGFGHVEFATHEAALKALELNGLELFGRAVRLDLARERGAYTPQSGKESYAFQKSAKGKSQTVFVRGFDKSLEEDQIRSSLEDHFGSCGEITRISIPKDYETGASKGIAYMDFKDQDAFSKALNLDDSELGGYSLTVEEAKPRGDNRDGGRSGGRGGGRDSAGRSGGRFGSRGGGRGGGGRGGRGGSRGRGGAPSKQRGGSARTGKKTTFSDD